jgi:sugar/nucleoside kinase (ribokinase family)
MFPNVTARITPQQIRERRLHIRQPGIFIPRHLSCRCAGPEAIRIARDAGVKVIFDLDVDPTYFVQSGLGTEADLMSAAYSDVMKPCGRGRARSDGASQTTRRLPRSC